MVGRLRLGRAGKALSLLLLLLLGVAVAGVALRAWAVVAIVLALLQTFACLGLVILWERDRRGGTATAEVLRGVHAEVQGAGRDAAATAGVVAALEHRLDALGAQFVAGQARHRDELRALREEVAGVPGAGSRDGGSRPPATQGPPA